MELRIGHALVQNELQAARIEKFAVQEAIKAGMLAGLDVDDQRYSLRFPIPKEHESEAGYLTRLRPVFCVMFLSRLKRLIEKRGPRPDEDVDFLRLMYGSQLTAFAEWILIHYQILETRESLEKADENIKERKIAHHQACILEAIETEIQAQELRQKFENIRELFEPTSDSVVLPPPDVDDSATARPKCAQRAVCLAIWKRFAASRMGANSEGTLPPRRVKGSSVLRVPRFSVPHLILFPQQIAQALKLPKNNLYSKAVG
jgi:hypothetical protein